MLKTKIAVFVSGGGTNLQALIDAQKSGILQSGEIALVLASNHKAYALTRAAENNIPSVVVVRKEFDSQLAYEEKVKEVLKEYGIELIVLAGFMSILSENFTSADVYKRQVVNHVKGRMALAHNGNLVNSFELRRELELEGSIFHTTSDTEVISYIITKERLKAPSIEEAVNQAMYRIKGAYSLVVMSATKMIAARDPHGFHPLCYGVTKEGTYVIASETCALDVYKRQALYSARFSLLSSPIASPVDFISGDR